MEMEFVVLLKSGTEDGEVKQPLVPPECFSSVISNHTKDLLMRAVKRIVDHGEKPMMQIHLRYSNDDFTIIESPMVPICFTENPSYPLSKN